MVSNLSDALIEDLYKAFIESFSDYELKIDMPVQNFKEMLLTRSFCKDYSIGFYDSSILAGFILIGYRVINNKKAFYDAGTGVLKEYRRKGIGNRLINETLDIMIKNDIDMFLLEVLENNVSAIELYKKNGFVVSRKLNCYEISKTPAFKNLNYEIVLNKDKELIAAKYCSFEPTWQNADESFINVQNQYNVIRLKNKKRIIGYVIIHRDNGNIMQFGVAPEYRNVETISSCINLLLSISGKSKLKYLNVEAGSRMDNLFKELKQQRITSQYEMIFSR